MKIAVIALSIAFAIGSVAGCGDDGAKPPPDAPMIDAPPPDPAMLTIDRLFHQFGFVTIGQSSPATTFTVTNTGDVATGFLQPAVSGGDAASFVGLTGCTFALQPGQSCMVSVTFAPTSPGTKSATLTVAGTPGGSVSAALEGEGISLGALTVSTSTNALGTVVVGQLGTVVSTFTVTNTGGAASGTVSVQVAGSDPADFTKSADQCAGSVLGAGAACTFQVRFSPLSVGAKSAVFRISANPGGVVNGTVTGTGVAPASLVVVPLSLDLGSVVVGQSSATLTATLVNTGGVPTGVIAQTVTGASAAMFTALGTCNGAQLAAGATCTVTVQFNPTSTGGHAALLSWTASPGGTVATTLAGTGIAAGQLTISPSTHAFANTNVGQMAAARQFTVTNTSSIATGALQTALGGAQANQFQIIAGTDACNGLALPAGGQCTISVTFLPTIGGVAHASLTVAGAPGGSASAGLSGLGVGPAALSIAPPSRGFGSVVVGTSSAPLAFTITNTGGQASGVPAAALSGAGAAQFAIAGSTCTAAIAPGASCVVQVRFSPSAMGAASASLGVTATPGGSVSAALDGTGINEDGLVIIPSAYAMPPTTVGDATPPQTLTVLNGGESATGTISFSFGGPNAAEFSVASTTCTTLAPDETCTVTIDFTPQGLGTRTATLIATANPGGMATAALSAVSRPRIEIIAINSGPVVNPYDFGAGTTNNTTPQDVLITVRNNTTSNKPFTVTEAFGSPAQFATISTTCATTIGGGGGTCTVGVRFSPTTQGPKLGTITFSIGAGPFDAVAEMLQGTGVEGFALTALDGTSFGSVPNNTSSGVLRFQVSNAAGSPATGPVAISLVSASGQFVIVTDPCTGVPLASGASCVFTARVVATTPGPASATLTAAATPGGVRQLGLTVTVVSPVGGAPTDILLTPHTIAENLPTGTTVGQLTTIDPDVGDTFIYALVPGAGAADNASFTLAGDIVQTAGVFDFETKNLYTIRVRSTDSGGQVFEKAMTIDVTNVDEPPVATNDSATVAEDSGANVIDVLANDTDVDGGPKLVQSVTQPANGVVAITGGGAGVTYTPAMNYFGPDSFTYTLNGGSLATVSITVTPVDDLPVAVADTVAVPEDNGPTPIAVLANDTDVDGGPMQVISVTPVAHGTVVIAGGGSSVTYTPAANYNGPDSFTYTLNGGSSAQVSITVAPVDDPPLAVNDAITTFEDAGPTFVDVIANDTDVDGGPFMVSSFTQGAHGTVTAFQMGVNYQPAPGYSGPDAFTYTLNGGSTATVSVTVLAVDDPPVAVNDNVTVIQDSGANTLAVLANDTDVDGGPISITSVTAAGSGTVMIAPGNGAVIYTPNAGACNSPPGTSPDTFTYTLSPGGSTATVTVKIACLPTFTGPTDTSVGLDPHAVVLGDFNGDTHLDAAVANATSNDVSILLGQGDTTFAPAVSYPVGTNPTALATGDFNADTFLDLAVTNGVSNTVSILFGTGTGVFVAGAPIAVGVGPSAIAVGDFNADTRPDLVVTNAGANTASILLGSAGGTFTAAPVITTGPNPQGVAAADLNGDGRVDLAITAATANTVTVRLGNNDGTFTGGSSFPVGAAPIAVAIGDVNGDGRRDLVVTASGAARVDVLLNLGGTSFGAAASFGVGASPISLALGDFNRDGTLDVATADFTGNTVSVLVGTGAGAFGGPVTTAVSGPRSVVAGDLNHDNRLDLVVANSVTANVSVLAGN